MGDLHSQKIESEKRRVAIQGFFINSVLLFYFFYLIWSVSVHVFDLESFFSDCLYYFLAGSFGLAVFWSARKNSPGKAILYRTNSLLKQNTKALDVAAKYSPTKIFVIATLILTFWNGWLITKIDLFSLFSQSGLEGAQRIFFNLLQPEWKIISLVLEAMIETIFMAFMATALALPIAFLGGFFCARNLMKHSKGSLSFYYALRFLFNFTRSVEPMIWAVIFAVWIEVGPFAGMLALMVHTIASLAKLYSEQIENIDRGPIEAIEATGANRIQVVWYAVVPQIVLPFLAFTIYRWDINIRMATVIGLVGGGGIGYLLNAYLGLSKWNEVGTIVIVIAAVVWTMDYLSAKIREAIY